MTFLEGDAIVYLKQVNGDLTERLRETEEARRMETAKLRTILAEYIEEYGPATAYLFHNCGEEDCTIEDPCTDFIQGFY